MKLETPSLDSVAGAAPLDKKSLGALSLALLACSLFAACQQSESPAPSAPAAPEAPAAVSAESAPQKFAGPGHKPTDEELARFPDRLKTSPPVDLGNGPAPLAKTAAVLPTCQVTFNNTTSLGNIHDQAYMGFAIRSYYEQPCNTSYTVISAPITGAAYRLIPEDSRWCPTAVSMIAYRTSSGDCINPKEGKLWPRRLGNDANSDGISFNVHNSIHYKNFDLKSLYVHSGAVEVWVFTPAGSWLSWSNLTAGFTWNFPAGTTAGQVRIYESGRDARFLADNLNIAIHP